MNLLKKFTAKPCSLFVIDATLPSDNPLRFRKNFLEIMAIDDKIRGEKLQYGINRETAKNISFIIWKN